jgi:hypothetical protein
MEGNLRFHLLIPLSSPLQIPSTPPWFIIDANHNGRHHQEVQGCCRQCGAWVAQPRALNPEDYPLDQRSWPKWLQADCLPRALYVHSLQSDSICADRISGVPGYPYWMWRVNYQESLPLLKKYRENSLPSDSPEMHRIRAAAKENQIFVSLGYSEVDLNSLYTTQVLISPTGDILNHRRKIRATHVERLVFGDGMWRIITRGMTLLRTTR